MKRKSKTVLFFLACWLLLQALGAPAFGRDPQNCLFCHKYRRLRGYDEQGVLHNYYVDAPLFNESIHREVACIDCHSDIDQVPHDPVVAKVDCAKACHLDTWKAMTGTFFSHRAVAEKQACPW